MASGIVKRDGNRYDAVYEKPWAGVASDADPADIAPSQLVTADGVFVKDGKLCAAGWGNTQATNFSTAINQGFFTLSRIREVFLVRTAVGTWVTVALNDVGDAFFYDPLSAQFLPDQTLTGGTMLSLSCYQVIAGVVYIFDFEAGASYNYTPLTSYTVNSIFVAGQFCMTLDNYLMTFNTNQPTDVPPVKANRWNWSTPFIFSSWDPAVDRTSGFNTLSSAADEITGAFAMGNVGYILRSEGLTQLSPTGVGTAPFADTSVWDSVFGIGCSFPDSFAQYGSLAIWANTNNIYAFFNGAMPQQISGAAQSAIYDDINQYDADVTAVTSVTGAIANVAENSIRPELCYYLAITTFGPNVPGTLQSKVWTYNINQKSWTRQIVNLGDHTAALSGDATPVQNMFVVKALGVLEPNKIQLITTLPPRRINTQMLATFSRTSGTTYSFLFSLFYNELGTPTLFGIAEINTDLVFREEEMRLGTFPTVRGVLVKAAGSGTINVSISGVPFTPITVTSPTTAVYSSFGLHSVQNPQLELDTNNFDGYIVKANMNITFDEGNPL